MRSSVVDSILALYSSRGDRSYGEAVTEREHALQCAAFAEQFGEPENVIVAVLLHDIGHLLHGLDEEIAERGIDGEHETVGAEFLARHFPPHVVDPVRLHVAAKRYLCGTNARYLEGLSPASRQSLALQGGPMSVEEQRAFEREPHFESAIRARRYDDMGKVPHMKTRTFESYAELIKSFVVSEC